MARAYRDRREIETERGRALSAAGRDIGALPAVVNPERKALCERDFRAFCETYFPVSFGLRWSSDHLTVLGQIEECILEGGLFATAMPRGAGKTTLVETACIWGALYGHRDFISLIGSDEGHACQMLDSIKRELESNESLLEDFPSAVYPISCLQGIAHRCKGQTCQGERTHVGWSADEVILPKIKDSPSSSVIIKVAGLTGGLRGMKYKRPDGKTVRPSLVVVDDPQTDQSARSPAQCETRERILAGAILGLAGPGRKISGIMPCTVIRPGDMADRILNREKHPEWNGTRTKMVYAFPTNEKLWDEYSRIRAEGFRAGDSGKAATEFYRLNREAMDLGARVAWEDRYNPDEISALQHAMNLKLLDERAFHAEYQNDPLPDQESRSDDLTPDQVAGKLNRLGRGSVPIACNRITAFIDVHAALLYWVVCAWEDDFTGYVIDYGVYPKQDRVYFQLRDAKKTLEEEVEGAGLEGRIYAGLKSLTSFLCPHDWQRDDGALLRIERLVIDANWGTTTNLVYKFCRESEYTGIIMPSHGKYIGASNRPIREYTVRPGDKLGMNWMMPSVRGKRSVRYVFFDSNYWKTFVHNRLSTAPGDKGCLSLFGDKESAHRLFADHVCSEFRVRTQGRGRDIDEWKIRPQQPDNHWFDCLVGCAVGASIQGVTMAVVGDESTAKPTARVKYSDMQRSKRGANPLNWRASYG